MSTSPCFFRKGKREGRVEVAQKAKGMSVQDAVAVVGLSMEALRERIGKFATLQV